MSSYFRYQAFVAVSGNLWGKVPVVDNALSSHEQEIYPTTSLDENCIGTFTLIWEKHIWLWNRHLSGVVVTKLTIPKKKKEHKEEAKAEEEETAEEDAPVPLVTHVNNILLSIFSNVEVYINRQLIYNSNGLYAHKSYIFNNFKGAISKYKGVLHCEGYDYEEFVDENT